MHYEGAVTIKELANVDTFSLTDGELHTRWASLILAFIFAGDGLAIPAEWFSPELKPKTSELNSFAAFHHRLLGVVTRMPETAFRKNVLGCLKVNINFY